jgi:hypothetical protein
MGLLSRMSTPPPKKRPGVGTSSVPIVTHPVYGTSFTLPSNFAQKHQLGPFTTKSQNPPDARNKYPTRSQIGENKLLGYTDSVTGEWVFPTSKGGRRSRNKKTVKRSNRRNKTKRNLRK